MATRTPLTYYGGKQRLAHRIVAMMPPHSVYLEPFCGGAAVLFAKPRCPREVLNDIDGRVVRFWRVLRERPDELVRAVELTPYSRAEWEHCRDEEDVADDVEASRRFLVTIDQSFARAARGWSPPSLLSNRPGRWQAGSWSDLPPRLGRAASRLRGVALEHTCALELIGAYDVPGALIYCDPPYEANTRGESVGRDYRHDDDGALWPRLRDILLAVRHAAVILSGYPCEQTAALEQDGWRRVALHHRRSASARAGSVVPLAPEHMWITPRHAQLTLLDDTAAGRRA